MGGEEGAEGKLFKSLECLFYKLREAGNIFL